MSPFLIALKSLFFHRRVNFAIALGVAAATAVLTGALIVGDSMRGSLRDLTLDRLGQVDVMIFSEGFFREQLGEDLKETEAFQSHFGQATPIIFFPNGTAETKTSSGVKNLGQVNLLGIRDGFWEFENTTESSRPTLAENEIIINSVVAEDLGIDPQNLNDVTITVGVPKQSLLPSDSSLGDKQDLVERIVDLKVVGVIPATGLGRFGLHPTQIPPRNAYLSIEAMQDALNDGILKYKASRQQANVLLLSSKVDSETVTPEQSAELASQLQPPLADLGLSLKHVKREFQGDTVFEYFSLASDRLVLPTLTANNVQQAFPGAQPLLTYLANDIANAENEASEDSGIPFSMVTGMDLDEVKLESVSGQPIAALKENEIAITDWAADDQALEIGDKVRISYFEPETTHGDENEVFREFVVADIVRLVEPSEGPRDPRRRARVPAVFDERPTLANDPDMTPSVPGLTDADSIDDWDLPFETNNMRRQDDDFWNLYRTTPKAYVSLDTARELWASRFGQTTSFRIPANQQTTEQVAEKLVTQFRSANHLPSLQVVPVKANGLKASSGTTPFDALFLGLSMFVIGAALALVSLLFRLALQQRSEEMGTMLANGFRQKQVGRIWSIEMVGVCLIGALTGLLMGIGYAALMLYGLKTWWVGAITTPFLNMHINWWTLPAGLILGVLICAVTIYISVRSARKKSVRALLSGQLESLSVDKASRFNRYSKVTIIACGLLAIVLTVLAATTLTGESQAGGFMTSGFLVLAAALVWIFTRLQRVGQSQAATNSLMRLSQTSAGRNPLRSTLTIGLVASACFLILAISAFRLAPSKEGTAGFNYLATTSQPIFANLNTVEGQQTILTGDNDTLDPASRVLSFRYKPGQDASCNNPYQSSQPQVLGLTPETMAYFDDDSVDKFSFAMTGGENPWRALQTETANNAIPVIIDKNTAWYSLKVYVPGTEFTVNYDSGETVTFRLVGLLSNSVLQGTLIVSESNFTSAFPDLSGYRTFLMKLSGPDEADRLATALSDQGFDAQSTERLLNGFLAVQNTYLSTFQSLGLLGLLLGTFGLAAVQLRAIMERRKELGLMRAVGYTRRKLARMILIENAWLLLAGMVTGILAALVTTLPHYFFGDASIPWAALLTMFGFIGCVGLLTSWLASRRVFKAPLIESLRLN